MQDPRVHKFWKDGDRQGYIDFCVANLGTYRGIVPTRSVAGRWFNLGTIITNSQNDLWLHQDGTHLWWTITSDAEPIVELGVDLAPLPRGPAEVYFYRKPAQPWSNKDRLGRPLVWKGLHPKAPDFLVTEATLQQLSEHYADYAEALIAGDDLDPWHRLSDWKAKTEVGSRKHPLETDSDGKKTFFNMAYSAWETTKNSNGQIEERKVKEKNFGFPSREALQAYIEALYGEQGGLCALTGITLQFIGGVDHQLCCSLDRIDSSGHYEAGNLQVVCKFINIWKGPRDDNEFKRLIGVVRQSTDF
jgi:hypothetical protein